MEKIFFIIVVVLIFVSCKKGTRTTDIQVTEVEKDPIQYVFEFPDTVYINQPYNGSILYESILDTITTSFDDEIYNRYVIYCMRKTNNVDYNFKELKKMTLDTAGAYTHRKIPLFNIQFAEKGVQYIDGTIEDHVFIDTLNNIGKFPKDHLVRYITNEVRATHKVVVIEE